MAKQKKNKYQEYEDAYDEYEAIYGDDYDGYSDDDPVSSEQADFRDDDDVRLPTSDEVFVDNETIETPFQVDYDEPELKPFNVDNENYTSSHSSNTEMENEEETDTVPSEDLNIPISELFNGFGVEIGDAVDMEPISKIINDTPAIDEEDESTKKEILKKTEQLQDAIPDKADEEDDKADSFNEALHNIESNETVSETIREGRANLEKYKDSIKESISAIQADKEKIAQANNISEEDVDKKIVDPLLEKASSIMDMDEDLDDKEKEEKADIPFVNDARVDMPTHRNIFSILKNSVRHFIDNITAAIKLRAENAEELSTKIKKNPTMAMKDVRNFIKKESAIERNKLYADIKVLLAQRIQLRNEYQRLAAKAENKAVRAELSTNIKNGLGTLLFKKPRVAPVSVEIPEKVKAGLEELKKQIQETDKAYISKTEDLIISYQNSYNELETFRSSIKAEGLGESGKKRAKAMTMAQALKDARDEVYELMGASANDLQQGMNQYVSEFGSDEFSDSTKHNMNETVQASAKAYRDKHSEEFVL